MRIGAIVRCYKITEYLPSVLESLKDVDRLILANGSFFGVNKDSDDTFQIAENAKISGQTNIVKYAHSGLSQKEVFNNCLSYLKDMDFVLVNDADEILLKRDRDEIIRRMEERRSEAGMCTVIDYANKDRRYKIRGHKPVVVIRPHLVFDGNRSVSYGEGLIAEDIHLHHFGYCLKRDLMNWKTSNIWYPEHDLTNITNSKTEIYEKPKELIDLLKI